MKLKKKEELCLSLSYSSSSSSSSFSYKNPDTVLKLLPLTILALTLALPPQDQEVVAYMITRSIFTADANPSSEVKKINKYSKKSKRNQRNTLFECGCFDCYTSFWYRWDSSPNRDLIHEIIEAFEEHLLHNEPAKKHNKGRKKGKIVTNRFESNISIEVREKELKNNTEMSMPETESGNLEENGNVGEVITRNLEMELVTVQGLEAPVSRLKGLARKVLPDVVGLLNSRLWSMWSPNI